MSYYRYITGVYKSFVPQLNRTLRSRSVPRRIPDLEISRQSRASSLPPSASYSCESFIGRHSATPFRDRAASVPPRYELRNYGAQKSYNYSAERSSNYKYEATHYTDFDCKVIDYMGKLDRQSEVKNYVSQARTNSHYADNSFASRYNYYDGNKHARDYLYPVSQEVLGKFKHFHLSNATLNERNTRSTSPLVSRELDRYYGTQTRVDYLGDVSSGGATDFRHYNYRSVPYLGGSDHYKYLNRTCKYSIANNAKYENVAFELQSENI